MAQPLSNAEIYARLYNSANVAQGSEFEVSQGLFDNSRLSDVAIDAAGGFVVTWLDLAREQSRSD